MAVTPAVIAVALGQTAPESDSPTYAQWELWIADAYMLIAARVELLEADEPDEAKVDYVVREAVVAQVRRPDDATQVTVSIDDGSTSKTYRSGGGRVSILDEWWILLGLTDLSGAFSLDMVPTGSSHLPWCAYSLGALYCSCGVDIAGEPIYEFGY
jgi:hypothetical protein